MSKISDIYNALTDTIETALPDYWRIAQAYSVEANTYLTLTKGFGIAVGRGVDTKRYVGCLISWQRTFTVILINQMVAQENDLTTRVMIEQDILEDHATVRKAIYNNSTMGGTAIESTVTEDAGLHFVDADLLKFLAIQMTVTIEYQENPNS